MTRKKKFKGFYFTDEMLSNREKKHGWGDVKAVRDRSVEVLWKIINDDKASNRDRNIAIKTLNQINRQNMDLDNVENSEDAKIIYEIVDPNDSKQSPNPPA